MQSRVSTGMTKPLHLVKAAFAAIVLIVFICSVSFGAPGDVDLSFDARSGVSDPVATVMAQPDGKILIGGSFTTVRNAVRNYIARLNNDGTVDETFNPGTGANGYVQSLALQADGKIVVGGEFT